MGIAQKVQQTELEKKNKTSFDNPVELTKKEIEFILAKLRLSTYTGDEFEMFYNVWVKLTNRLEKLN